MEKSFKRKMLIVAIAHFLFSSSLFFVPWGMMLPSAILHYVFQPLILGLFKLCEFGSWKLVFIGIFGQFSEGVFVAIYIAIIPLWSFCFGWLYAKAVDRLNRFPILGHKLF